MPEKPDPEIPPDNEDYIPLHISDISIKNCSQAQVAKHLSDVHKLPGHISPSPPEFSPDNQGHSPVRNSVPGAGMLALFDTGIRQYLSHARFQYFSAYSYKL